MPSQTTNSPHRAINGRKNGDTSRNKKVEKFLAIKSVHNTEGTSSPKEAPGLQNYQLGDCLGKGAFGSVYRALNWGTGETVAVKQVKLAQLPKSELRVIMLEIDLLKNLNHPNIVKYHGFEQSTESLYIILEYCENGSLHSICKNFGKFPENLVALYMSQVLCGLLYLHEQGVIHRDIKGANILTTKDGLVKLADFGVATRASGLHESSVVGTPYWMAPEVIELSGATTASDIWSLACTVIELLDGKPPYHKLPPMPALFRIVNDDHPPFPESLSPAVQDFLMQCFQKEPNVRVTAKKLLKHPWILNARRTDSVVSVKTDDAVKTVQQWNEALKSPNHGSIPRSSRYGTSSPIPQKQEALRNPTTPDIDPPKDDTEILRQLQVSTIYESPTSPDHIPVWDDDFDPAISTAQLKDMLPQLKPVDNFDGLLSTENLKAYASNNTIAEHAVENLVERGDLTVKSPSKNRTRAIQPEGLRATSPAKSTVRGLKPSRKSPLKVAERMASQPKTQILRPSSKVGLQPVKLPPLTRTSSNFREKSVEDYDDLSPNDDAAFNEKLKALALKAKQAGKVAQLEENKSLSPQLTNPSDLEHRHYPPSKTSSKAGGSLRQNRVSFTEDRNTSVRRTQSNVEILKFADYDYEDYSDILGKHTIAGAMTDSESGSDEGIMNMTNSKLSINEEDEEWDDPFAGLEDTFADMELETQVARDKHVRTCALVETLIGSLKVSQPDDVLATVSEQLMEVLFESPEMQNIIISSHGLLPILEVLENCPRRDISLRLLKIINTIISDSQEIQETLCFVGGIPIITKFAHKKYPSEIRLEAAVFVRHMYQTSTLTLQMFISCGGLYVLVDFLEEDYEAEKDLVLIGVNGISSVFNLEGPTPKNDFCRILSRSSVLYPLSLVLNRVLDEDGDLAGVVEGRITNIFLLFSRAENHVKESVSDRMVLKRVLKDLHRMSPDHQVTMLKFIKNLSMLSTTLDPLHHSNAIEVLTDLLRPQLKSALESEPASGHHSEVANQILNTMFNLCRLSKTRQEDAALNGVVPLLQRVVRSGRPLREFALPILCDMAHSGNVTRKILWQNKGLDFYIDLLLDRTKYPSWQVPAMDAIFNWLQEETARVEEYLLESEFSAAIVSCFIASDVDFENLLEPLQKLLRLSPPVAATLAKPELFIRARSRLSSKKAVLRGNILRIIRSICDGSDEDSDIIRQHGLYDVVEKLADHDPAILVRNMAADLIKSSDSVIRASTDGKSYRLPRRTSSSTMTPPPLLINHSQPQTPQTPQTSRSTQSVSYFDISSDTIGRSRAANINGTSYRPVSRDGSKTVLDSTPVSQNGSSAAPTRSRLPRTSAARLSRSNLYSRRDESATPKSTSNTNGTPTSALIVNRRRRQTSDVS